MINESIMNDDDMEEILEKIAAENPEALREALRLKEQERERRCLEEQREPIYPGHND